MTFTAELYVFWNCDLSDVFERFDEWVTVKVVLYNIDVTAMCSVPKCKQSSFIDH